MKKFIGFLISVTAVLAMVFTVSGCSEKNASVDPDAYAFVTIDINPSVELVTIGENIAEVKAANYDACVLLDGEDFSSMTLEEATEKIVSLADEMGYLTDTNNQVKITVISDDAQAVEVLKNAAKAGAKKGSNKAVTDTQPRLQDELTVKKLKDEEPDKYQSLTEEKVRLIESLMQHDSSMTYETGAAMTVKELAEMLKAAVKEDKAIITNELRSEYSARYAAAKLEIERSIAEVYGTDYLEAWEKYNSLEGIYNQIKERLDKSGLSEDDISAIMQLLDITDKSLIEKGGVVKAEYVYNYIDKHFKKKGSQTDKNTINSVLEIIDRYDAKRYVLTGEEIAEINAAAGEEIAFTTLSEFAHDLSKREAQLNAMRKAANLTDEQVARIKQLKESFSSVKQNVLDSMQDLIESVKEQIAAAKQERGNA